MKKRDKIFLCIGIISLIVLCAIVILSLSDTPSDERECITVTGDASGYQFEAYYGKQLIHIKDNGLTVSGKALRDTYLIIYPQVSELTISNLNQNKWKIHVIPDQDFEGPEKLYLTYSGDNEICILDDIKSISLNSKTSDDKLLVSSGLDIINNLNIDGGQIVTGYLSAFEHIQITGKTRLYIKDTRDQNFDDNLWLARIDGVDLYIDLDKNGIICIEDCTEYQTINVNRLELGNNTKMIYPENGQLLNYNNGETPYASDASVFNADGTDCEKIIFEYRDQ